jgi:sugar transferase EpsL
VGVYRRWGKRFFDLVLTIPGLIVLAPWMAIIALLVRGKIRGPVFFRQKRPGLYGKSFTLYKFRTMIDVRDDQNKCFPDIKRLTSIGRILRRLSLDELPELWDIIKGDMSLVGPRPLLMQYLERYTPEQARRHEVKPGITGWAQVNGRNALTWEERFKLDVWYVDHVSFLLDVKILALTVWKVIKREGINQPGHATMKEFMGTGN